MLMFSIICYVVTLVCVLMVFREIYLVNGCLKSVLKGLEMLADHQSNTGRTMTEAMLKLNDIHKEQYARLKEICETPIKPVAKTVIKKKTRK